MIELRHWKHVITYIIGVCLISVSLLVFINASTPFIITDVVGKRHHVGNDVGTLGFADELVAVIASLAWGTLSDYTGARIVVSIGYLLIATALFCSVSVSNVYPELLLARVIFSIGGAAVSTMITAILPSIGLLNQGGSADRFDGYRNVPNIEPEDDSIRAGSISREVTETSPILIKSPNKSKSFEIAGIVGTAGGCGALLAVFGFLKIPPKLQAHEFSAEGSLRLTFYIVTAVTILAALLCFLGLNGLTGLKRSGVRSENLIAALKAPLSSITAAYRNDAIALAYLGGFVARSSSVALSSFIPLWVNYFFIDLGSCPSNTISDAKRSCPEAYSLASQLVGISQLAALLSAPLWGFVSSRHQLFRVPLLIASLCGSIGYIGISTIKDPRLTNWKSTSMIVSLSVLLGISQIGAIVCSLGLLGSAIARDHTSSTQIFESIDDTAEDMGGASTEDAASFMNGADDDDAPTAHYHRCDLERRTVQQLAEIQGSIAGMYSLIGGIGILLLTKIGGLLFDSLSMNAPFLVMATFNGLLLILSAAIIFMSYINHKS